MIPSNARRPLLIAALAVLAVVLAAPMALSQTGSVPKAAPVPVIAQVVEPPTVTVTATDAAASESGSDGGTFTVARTGPTTDALTVNYTVAGTATGGSDYPALSGSVTIASGQSSATAGVAPVNDLLPEDDETVVLTLVAGTGYTVGSPSSATVTIDDDDLPVVTVAATDVTASEAGSDPGTFTISRTGSTTNALTVNYALGGTAGTGDYAALPGSVVIPAGQISAPVTVTPIDDALSETTETVSLSLSPSPAYAVGSPGSAVVSITDNDPAVVSINATDDEASEAGADTGAFTVTRTGPVSSSLTVNYTITGTATNGVDYVVISGSVVIASGSSSGTITITPVDDAIEESNETVTLTVVAGAGYVVGSNNADTVEIADNDGPAPPVTALLPTTKDQCKKGGWQTFGVFKNQGDCVSFVATEGRNPPNG
jgi:hypothetical protein